MLHQLSYTGIVTAVGIEPTLSALQTDALTNLATQLFEVGQFPIEQKITEKNFAIVLSPTYFVVSFGKDYPAPL